MYIYIYIYICIYIYISSLTITPVKHMPITIGTELPRGDIFSRAIKPEEPRSCQ